jgi:hypothetical protein
MGIVVVPSFGADPVTITGPTLDAKVDGLATEFNGEIDNDNVASDAAIGNSKLNLASISQNITHSGTMTHSGTLTMTAKDISEAKCADIASASTTTIWATDGNYAHITGTTTITSFGTAGQAGDCRTIVFDGALTLTHNATSLILPTGANITTAAGDTAIVRAETTANARVIAYLRKDGTAISAFTPSISNALSGSVIQTVNTNVVTSTSGTTQTPLDDTVPTISEGDQYLTRAITPNNSSNLLEILAIINGSSSDNASTLTMALHQDGGAAIAAITFAAAAGSNGMCQGVLRWYMTAGTTSSTTFTVRVGGDRAQTFTFNGFSGARKLGGVCVSSITIREIKA